MLWQNDANSLIVLLGEAERRGGKSSKLGNIYLN